MHHANNENWETTHDGRSRTTKSSNKKEAYKWLKIFEAVIKQVEIKQNKTKQKKEYPKRTRKLLET